MSNPIEDPPPISNIALPIALPLRDCTTPTLVVVWLDVIGGWSSTLLFLFRIYTIHRDRKLTKFFFVFLWCCVAFSFLVFPFSIQVSPGGPGGLCIVTHTSRLQLFPSLMIGMFDCAIYISVSYRMIDPYARQDIWSACKAFFSGKNASPVAKALLRTGQLYFL